MPLLLATLTACTPIPPQPTDSKPPWHISAEQVSEMVPKAESITAAGNSSPYRVNGREYKVLDTHHGYRESGIASWYGHKFHGRPTANGEIFDAALATAAHRSLPLPVYVRVTNLDNFQSIVVRVNDRGPFHSERIIDLSYGAAVKLGFAEQGTAPVEVVALHVQGSEDLREHPLAGNWKRDYRFLQVGAFSEQQSAENLQQRLAAHNIEAPVEINTVQQGSRAWYRVRIGPLPNRQQLLKLQQRLQELGFTPQLL